MPGPGIELVGAEETAEVMEVLQSGYLSRYGPSDDPAFGAKVHHVEEAIAELTGVKHALALHGGGSAALWITLLSLGIGAGDEVIVPGFTYVASISAIVYTGATPILAEIDQTFDLDPADVEARITPRTAGILVVHMLGGPARIDELKSVADRHGIPLIEDCAQAFGATYKGRGVGGFGAAGTFSFNEFKTITCGDGGMIVTDDDGLYERAFAMHDQGHAPDRLESKYAPRPFLGMNFRMTELSGAVLGAQVRKLDQITSHLRANKAIVKDMLEEVGSRTLAESGWHTYSRMNHLLEQRTINGKGCPFDCGDPNHSHGTYRAGMLPQTDDLLERSLSIGIGVKDPNLAPFGLRMRDGAAEARQVGATFRDAVIKHLA